MPSHSSSDAARSLRNPRKPSDRLAVAGPFFFTLASILALATALCLAPDADAAEKPPEAAPRIEVAFVLDTTGSMDGLIEGAKSKIWSIVNEIARAEPTPEVRLALVGYRDRGDEYVTRVFDLTDDIDEVYGHLQKFEASGGGDTPESVNQALHEAVHEIGWSKDRKVLKLVFLVGDAPPHMDYEDDVRYPEVCQQAVRKDLIINTVQCGNQSDTTPVLQEIARASEGTYVAIGQTGDMQVVATPMDARLAQLNAAVGETLVTYGSAREQRRTASKQVASETAAPSVAADRLAYNSATAKVVQGGGDLVEALENKEVELEELKDEELPDELRGKSLEQKKAHLERQANRREKLQKEITELLRQREEYLKAERDKLEKRPDGFDEEVTRMLREQARRKGIKYSDEH